MPIIDISRTLEPGIATWEGDTPFDLKTMMSLEQGDSINLTTLTLSAHTGTHVDAPFHFVAAGEKIEMLDLLPYWGPAQVVTVEKEAGQLVPEDFEGKDLSLAPRLLVHSPASGRDPRVFHPDFVYPHPELVPFLAEQGIILWGTDSPSVDHVDSKSLEGHHALFQHGIAILEGLELTNVPDGVYELVALPLKISYGDGSPVRAALRY